MTAKVLIVDDSPAMRVTLRRHLTNAGYEVVEADDGTVGLQRALQLDVQLLIVDVNMPVMGGFEMLEALRKVPGKEQIPAVVLSAESSDRMVAKGRKCGAVAWMVKPIQPRTFAQQIARVLQRAA